MNNDMRARGVLVLYDIPRTSADHQWSESDAGVLGEVDAVMEALASLSIPHDKAGVRNLSDVHMAIAAHEAPVVWNLVESTWEGEEDASFVPASCRAAGRAVTGNGTACLLHSYHKWIAKALLQSSKVRTALGRMFPAGSKLKSLRVKRGTYIVKPASCDGSEGIEPGSVVEGPGPELDAAIRRVVESLGYSALVEEYVAGREFNVSIIERNGAPCVMPLAEIDFSTFPDGKPRIVDYAAKWIEHSFEYQNTPRILPAILTKRQEGRIRRAALGAWFAMGCHGYVRVDLRMDERDRVYVIEVNPNPDISPEGGFASAIALGGVSYAEFVRTMVENARNRAGFAQVSQSAAVQPPSGEVVIVSTAAQHVEPIMGFLGRTDMFRTDELAIAREVIGDALLNNPPGDYCSITALLGGEPVGWLCCGPTACTLGTWDIYWIGVAPEIQRKGIGRKLLQHAEVFIASHGGRLAVIETSGRQSYVPTRGFYESVGYRLAADIPDFYGPGDAKVMFTRMLGIQG